MTYILKRTDQGGGYVAPSGSKNSYTRDPLKAKRYDSKKQAIADSCIENEVPVNLNHLINGY